MLETLELNNFQCHKKRKVSFGSVTSVIGPNDSGKTSLIRFLKWLATNQTPKGDFIAWDKNYCKGVLTIDGRTAGRYRSKRKNYYTLDGKKLKAAGKDVPTPVAQLLNLSEVNFQSDWDKVFWFADTSGEVARQLNKVVNLEVIDTTLANLESDRREAKTRVRLTAERLQDARQLRKDLAWAAELDADLAKLQNMEENLTGLKARLHKCQELQARRTYLKNRLKEASGIVSALGQLVEAGSGLATLAESLQEARERHSSLLKLKGQLCKAEKQVKRARKKLAEYKTCPVCKRPFTS